MAIKHAVRLSMFNLEGCITVSITNSQELTRYIIITAFTLGIYTVEEKVQKLLGIILYFSHSGYAI